MKKIFILAAAIVAFASCSKNEPEATYNDGVIRFKNAPATRATLVTDAIGKEFTVLGYVADTKLFNEVATKNTAGTEWETSTVKYWAENTAYTFFGVYPSKTISESDKTKATVAYTNEGDEDLVMAGLSMTSGAAAKEQDPAALIFKHALSRVKFSFTNKFTDNQLKVKVENVKLNARKGEKATATITAGPTTGTANTSTIAWTDLSAGTTDLAFDFDGAEGDGNAIEMDGVETTDYQYIIPNAAAAYTMAADITVYTDAATIHTYKITDAKVVIGEATSFNFEYGKSYTFNMNVTDNLNVITFTVDVEDWINGVGGDINFDTTK